MSTRKHTPGPWIAGQREDGDPDSGPDGTCYFDGTFLAVHNEDGFITHEEVDLTRSANARLIAAAPEMLDALKQCLIEHGGFTIKGDVEKQARAAIAKAEGAT